MPLAEVGLGRGGTLGSVRRALVVLAWILLAALACECGYRACYVHPFAFVTLDWDPNGQLDATPIIVRHKRYTWLPLPLVHERRAVWLLGDSRIGLSLCGFRCNCLYGPAPAVTQRSAGSSRAPAYGGGAYASHSKPGMPVELYGVRCLSTAFAAGRESGRRGRSR